MRTKLLQTASAVFLAALGLAATFAPGEILSVYLPVVPRETVWMVQLGGALLLGMAALNWMSSSNRVGGIYGRPLAMCNLIHFFVGAITLWKDAGVLNAVWWALAAGYTLFAVWFALVVFGPAPRS